MKRRFVSLGAWCQVAEQLRKQTPDEFVPSPFDWLVSPWEGMLRILEDDGVRFGQSLQLANGEPTKVCAEYGVRYHHEFPLAAPGKHLINNKTLAVARSKLLHKYNKMRNSIHGFDGEVVFIRFGGGVRTANAWPYSKEESEIKNSDLNYLYVLLSSKFADIDVKLLYLFDEQSSQELVNDETLSPAVRSRTVQRPIRLVWQGSDDAWNEILHEIRQP